jgi:peptidoglycan/xylan/chitin deacetylase (PgdA/CDA1 family)
VQTSEIKFGALTISLDFEIHWGVRDHFTVDGHYRQNLLGVRKAVPAMLDLFDEFGIAVTWATVGFLFSKSKDELKDYQPKTLPDYHNKALNPYGESIGNSEKDDLFHFAPSLIQRIKETPGQEIATHTFSHYYCLEPGQTAETFAADLDSAVALAEENDVKLRSIVFPRNQHNEKYTDILLNRGINCIRGNQPNWIYELDENGKSNKAKRALRLIDQHFNIAGQHSIDWNEIWENEKMANVRASYFLRPAQTRRTWMNDLRFKRLKQSLEFAAQNNKIVHLWWHPHNFGTNTEANIAFLRKVLEVYRECQEKYGMKSLSMSEVAQTAKQAVSKI